MSAQIKDGGVVDVLARAVERLRVPHPDHAQDAANNAAAIALHEYSAAVAELIESARALRSAHRAFQGWKAQAPKVYPAPRSILEMNAGAKARLFAALDRMGGAK